MARPVVLTIFVACAVFLIGCGTGEDAGAGPEAMPRHAVDDTTVSMLVQSQQALQQGVLRKALALADSVVERAPRLPDAHFQRGRVLSDLKRFDEAETAYREVLALDSSYQGAWFNLGNNAYRRQNFEEALQYFQNEREQHPSANTFVEIGKSYGAIGKPDSADQAYRQALERDSTHAAAHARLGELYEEEGDLESALPHSRKALELEPDNVNYRYVVGTQLFQLNRYEEAVEHLQAVLDARPWHQGAHYNLGQALIRLGRQDEGERYLTEADSLEERQREIERLESVAQDAPQEPERWTRLGDAYREAGRLSDAREAYSVALYLRPGDPQLRDRVAQLAAGVGDYQAAIAHYRDLVRRHPGFIDGWFNLGVVYARNGERTKARNVWERVLQKEPDHTRAKQYLARLGEDDS